MSSQVSTDGKRIWTHYRGSKCGFYLILTIGLTFGLAGLYKFAQSSDTTFLLIFAGGVLWALMALFVWGNNDVVFDDQTQSIYILKKRFCSTCSTTEKVGQYSGFQMCTVKEGWRGCTKVYSFNFIFEHGVTYEANADPYGHETKYKIAQEINEWWKTNPFNKASQPIPSAPIQVMVQQLRDLVAELSGIQGASNTFNTMPVAGGQVTYVQVQQPVTGQQVYQHIVQPQPQGHVVYVQQ